MDVFRFRKRSERKPTKLDSFARLRALGVPVGSVVDVGVQKCTGELVEAFPDVPHLLIEPVDEFEVDIRRVYGSAGIQYDLVKAAASDRDGDVRMKLSSVRETEEITHARMVDEASGASTDRVVSMRRLDGLLAERDFPAPYLLKVDVDGAELAVLRGAEAALAKCSVVCIEAGIRTFLERATFIMNAGFQAFDIVDLCYYDGRLVQTDMIFISNEVVTSRGLEIYKNGFDIAKWRPLQV